MDIPLSSRSRKSSFRTTFSIKFFILLSFIAVVCENSYGQLPNNPGNHEWNLQLLEKAKDSLYTKILGDYDEAIENNPTDYLLQIERCKLIEKAYYDLYEDYNPNYEESLECVDALIKAFPKVPEVLLYKSEFVYGDSATVFLKRVVSDFNKNPEKWKGKEIWKIYDLLASSAAMDDNIDEALLYGNLALKHNDTLDNSLLLARQYQKLNQNERAIECLDKHLRNGKQDSWNLSEKGKLLLELKAPKKALVAFELAKKDTLSWLDAGVFAQIMIENGLFDEARDYLVKDVEDSYEKSEALKNLFKYDLKYNWSDSAYTSYRMLVEDNFWNDVAGIYRLQLLWKAPLLQWSLDDVLRIGVLLSIFLAILLGPYIWVLPVHYTGIFFKNKGMILQGSNFRWGLRHFWFASSLYLLATALGVLVFEYDSFVSENTFDLNEVNKGLADSTLFFFSIMLFGSFLMVKKADLPNFWGNLWEKRQSILTGIGLAILLKFSWSFLSMVFIYFGWEVKPMCFLSIIDSIKSINTFYHPLLGFLFVVILVPVYEEILFRGVILSACEKHMKFFLANAFQSIIFAVIHQEWRLIPFFFAFGYLAGYYRRKSQSLAPAIAFHMTNNLLAFLVIVNS